MRLCLEEFLMSQELGLEMYESIKLHQEMNRAASMAYATLTGATVKILENHNDQLDVIVDKLFEVL